MAKLGKALKARKIESYWKLVYDAEVLGEISDVKNIDTVARLLERVLEEKRVLRLLAYILGSPNNTPQNYPGVWDFRRALIAGETRQRDNIFMRCAFHALTSDGPNIKEQDTQISKVVEILADAAFSADPNGSSQIQLMNNAMEIPDMKRAVGEKGDKVTPLQWALSQHPKHILEATARTLIRYGADPTREYYETVSSSPDDPASPLMRLFIYRLHKAWAPDLGTHARLLEEWWDAHLQFNTGDLDRTAFHWARELEKAVELEMPRKTADRRAMKGQKFGANRNGKEENDRDRRILYAGWFINEKHLAKGKQRPETVVKIMEEIGGTMAEAQQRLAAQSPTAPGALAQGDWRTQRPYDPSAPMQIENSRGKGPGEGSSSKGSGGERTSRWKGKGKEVDAGRKTEEATGKGKGRETDRGGSSFFSRLTGKRGEGSGGSSGRRK